MERENWAIYTKSNDLLRDQVKSFFASCDEETYTYKHLHSGIDLMRTLQTPYRHDICWRIQELGIQLLHNKQINGSPASIDRSDMECMKKVITDELQGQASLAAWDKWIEVEDVAIDIISKEYVQFLKTHCKERAKFRKFWNEANTNPFMQIPNVYK